MLPPDARLPSRHDVDPEKPWRPTALLRPHRARLGLALGTSLAASATTLLYPLVARHAIDVGMSARAVRELDLIAAGCLGLFAGVAAISWARYSTTRWLGERVVADLRVLVFDRLLTLPVGWFREHRSGELVGRLSSDVALLEGVMAEDAPMALRNTVQVIGGLIALLLIDAYLTLVLVTISVVIALITLAFGQGIRHRSRALQGELASLSGHLQECIGAIATVHAFARESHESRRYASGIQATLARAWSMSRLRAWSLAATTFGGGVVIVAVIWLGGRSVIQGDLSPGGLTSFFLYTFFIAGGLSDLANNWVTLQRGAGAIDRLVEVVNTVPELRDSPRARPLPPGRGTFRLEDVCFSYPSRPENPVLNDVDLQLGPGETIALVGGSGAGKSTLLALLSRLYDVTSGRVTFEGVDVRELDLTMLRRSIAVVSQDPVLFAGTIAENIRYGRLDATGDEVEQAARDANAHDFISSFPATYDTIVGERGATLSGGQRQRIALARALVANPRVLVLDEATSNLDAESEAAVQAALANISGTRTIIIVAHRLSTVRDASRVVVLEGARIVEQGTHDELMQRAGAYHRLVQHQHTNMLNSKTV
jgi:ABC-type multidrug transport system fused ATPase/permease subunit